MRGMAKAGAKAAAMALCVGLMAGCAMLSPISTGRAGAGEAILVKGVPFHKQDGHRCGPAAMAMMLGWTGVEIAPKALETQFAEDGRDPRARLVDSARRYGRFAYPITGLPALLTEVKAGHPVLVLENLGVASRPIWNCVVAVGFEGDGTTIVLHAGTEQGKKVSAGLLERLWSDADAWGLVVMRAGDMPATAQQKPFVEAARGLEKAGRYWEAVLALDTALSEWPGDGDALMGLGSSLYLLGDAPGSADAFRAASEAARDPKAALEALAHVLAELGRKDEALAAAQRAVSVNVQPKRRPIGKPLD